MAATQDAVGHLDITAYGAVGNGTSDDYTPVQNCINDAALITSGCEIKVPAGDFLNNTASWVFPYSGANSRNITFVGEGRSRGAGPGTTVGAVAGGASVLRAGAGLGANHLFDLTGGAFFESEFRQLSFNRNAGHTGSALRAQNMIGGAIIDCSFNDFGQDGVYLLNECFYHNFVRLTFNDTQLNFQEMTNGVVIRDSQFTKCSFTQGVVRAGYGPKTGGANLTFDGCTFEDTVGPAAEIRNMSTLKFNNCYFERIFRDVSGANAATGRLIFVEAYTGNLFTTVLISGCNAFLSSDGGGGPSGNGGSNNRALCESTGNVIFTAISNTLFTVSTNTGWVARFGSPSGCKGVFIGNAVMRSGGAAASSAALMDVAGAFGVPTNATHGTALEKLGNFAAES